MTFVSNNSINLLFRLLFTKRNANENSFKAAEKILQVLQDKDNSIALLLKQFLNQDRKSVLSKMEIDDDLDPIRSLQNSDLITNKKSNKILEQSETLGEKLGKLLLDNVEVEKTGLIVDWLTSVELEVANTAGGQLQVIKLIKYCAIINCSYVLDESVVF